MSTRYHNFLTKLDGSRFRRQFLRGMLHINKAYMKSLKTVPVERMRQHLDYIFMFKPMPSGITRKSTLLDHIYLETLTPDTAADQKAILYFHGGGYIIGSCITHRGLIANIARLSGVKAIVPEYRLAPENPFPAAIEDGIRVWDWLLSHGYKPENIIFMGDSAGGGLSLATMLSLKKRGGPLPAAVVCLSPWADMTGTSPTWGQNRKKDLIVSLNILSKLPGLYLRGTRVSPDHPLVSPVLADLRGCPPLYIQAGSAEVLLGDAIRLAEKATADGVSATLDIWDNMQHVWQIFSDFLPEGGEAIHKISLFVQRHLHCTTSETRRESPLS